MSAQVAQRGIKIHVQALAARPGDQAGARAIAAVGGAAVRAKQQNAIRVAVNQPGCFFILALAAGVIQLLRVAVQFRRAGNDLEPQRIRRVIRIEQTQEVRGDAHGEPLTGVFQRLLLIIRQWQRFGELLCCAKGMAQLPGGVIPLLRCSAHLAGKLREMQVIHGAL